MLGVHNVAPPPALDSMNPMVSRGGRLTVAIAGGGAAGSLTALHLARAADRRSIHLDIVVIDPAPRMAAGVAFGTPDERHLLNVPAAGMSAYPEDPGHFVQWRRRTAPDLADPYEFAPRRDFSRYLHEQLADAVSGGFGHATLRHVERTATAVAHAEGRNAIQLDNGASIDADALVVATGLPVTGADWAPPELRDSAFFVPDPWASGAIDVVRRDGSAPPDVLIVGTGLTMVDVVLGLQGTRPGRKLRAISRRGRLPKSHGERLVLPAIPDISDWGSDLAGLRARVRQHLSGIEASTGDVRPGVDGLRFQLSELWARLSEKDRYEFLREDAGAWGILRHRMPPSSAAALELFRSDGSFEVSAASIREVEPLPRGGLRVTVSDGTLHDVGWVVNCTGPQLDVSKLGNPLLDNLLVRQAVPSTAGMGFQTDNGRLIDADGSATATIWTLGALRRGELWESTAVPEIRTQALALATAILDELAPAPRRTADGQLVSGKHPIARPRDLLGLPLSTTADAANAFNTGLERLMRVQPGAEDDFAKAARLDPSFALAQVALAFIGHEGGAETDVPGSLERARSAVERRGDARERSLVRVFEERHRDPRRFGRDALLAHIAKYPRDVLAVSAAVPTIAFSGVVDVQAESWSLVEGLAPAYGDHWWYISLLAFVREEQGRFEEATFLAESAWSCEPSSGHAVHALTHALYETGQHEFGRVWIDHWVAENGRSASHQAHFSWHAGLHELTLLDLGAVRRRYESQLADVTGVRALVDSASLLWRWRVAITLWPGLSNEEPPSIGHLIGQISSNYLQHPKTPFIAFHAAIALAAAVDVDGLEALVAHSEASTELAFVEVVAPTARGLAALVAGDDALAVDVLSEVVPQLPRVGGSAAQREVIEDSLLLALVRHGDRHHAIEILDRRLARRDSPLDARRLITLTNNESGLRV